MRESSRRAFLAAGVGVAGLLAGCGAPEGDPEPTPTATPTATPTPTPTPTPAPALPDDAPESWAYLQTPSNLNMEPYAIGSLDLDALREGGLVQRNLNPNRYSPSILQSDLEATTELLTLSTPETAGGVLFGGYDTDAIRERLVEAEFEPSGGNVRYEAEGLMVQPEAERLLWGDDDIAPQAVVFGLLATEDETRTLYPTADPKLGVVLGQLTAAEARFATPISRDDGPLETALYLGTGIGTDEDVVTWRTAVSFADAAPPEARDFYQDLFEEKQGFENVRTRTSGALLVMDAETSPAWATSTQPI